MRKIVFITGASSGFGEACAYEFARAGYRLLLNGRRRERLEEVQQKIEKEYDTSCHLLPFDVRDREAVFAAIEGLPGDWKEIDVLVNNAGLALGRDPFDQASIDDWDTMLDTNVKGLLYVSRAVLPAMTRRKGGHIINIGSISGKEVYANGNVYCASKHAVDALNKAMRIELLPYGIKVTAIHPGAAETEFSMIRFKGNEEVARKVYEGYQPLSATDVASIVLYTASLPPHVCINDLVVTCTQQANSYHLQKES